MVLESKNKGNVLTLSFNDEKTKNSISANDWIEFRKQVKEFDESDLKYLVLSQSNGNFSSGAQLGENLNALMDDVTDAAQALWDCRKPVISLVDGICAGAGANMILLSDFIIEEVAMTAVTPHIQVPIVIKYPKLFDNLNLEFKENGISEQLSYDLARTSQYTFETLFLKSSK